MDSISDPKSFNGELYKSTVYSATEAPALGLAQILDGGSGKLTEPVKRAFDKIGVSAPESSEFNTSGWYGQVIGGAVGMLLPVGLIGRGTKAFFHSSAEAGLLSQRAAIGFSIKESALTGGIYGSVFTPSEGKDLLKERTLGGLASAETFGLLTGANLAIGSFARTATAANLGLSGALKNPIISGVLSGIPGGAINAENEALKNGHWFFDRDELAKEVYTMSIVGGLFGAKSKFLDKAPAPTVEAPAESKVAPSENTVRAVAAPVTAEALPEIVQPDIRSFRLLERTKGTDQSGKPDAVATDEAAALVKLYQQSPQHAGELAGIVGSRGGVAKLVADFLVSREFKQPLEKSDLRDLHQMAESAIAARRTFDELKSQPERQPAQGINIEHAQILLSVAPVDPRTTQDVLAWLGQSNRTGELAGKDIIERVKTADAKQTLEELVQESNENAAAKVNAFDQLALARQTLQAGISPREFTPQQAEALYTLGHMEPEAGAELASILGAHNPATKLLSERFLRGHENGLSYEFDVDSGQQRREVYEEFVAHQAAESVNAQRGLELLEKHDALPPSNSSVPYAEIRAYTGLRSLELRNQSYALEALIKRRYGAEGELALSIARNGVESEHDYAHYLKGERRFVETAHQVEKVASAYETAIASGSSPSVAAVKALSEHRLPMPERNRPYREGEQGTESPTAADFERLTTFVSEPEMAALQKLAEHSKERSDKLAQIIGSRTAEASFIARYLSDSPYTSKEELNSHITPELNKFADAIRLTQELSAQKAAGKPSPGDRISLREAQAILTLETSHHRYYDAASADAAKLRELVSERGPTAKWMLNFLQSRAVYSAEGAFTFDALFELRNAHKLTESHYNFAGGRRSDNTRAWDLSHELGPIPQKDLASFIDLSNRMVQFFDRETPKLSNSTLLEMAKDPRLSNVADDALPGIYARTLAFGHEFTYDLTASELTLAGRAWQFAPSLPADIAIRVGEKPTSDRVAAAAAWRNTAEGQEVRAEQMHDPGNRLPDVLEALRSLPPDGRHNFWHEFSHFKGNPLNRNAALLQDNIAIRPILKLLYPNLQEPGRLAAALNQTDSPFAVIRQIKPREFDAAYAHLEQVQREAVARRESDDDASFRGSMRHLWDQEHDTDHIVDSGATALQLTRVFGGGWKEWLAAQSKLGRTLHDATYWLPSDGRPAEGLGQFLRDNGSRAVNRLEIIAKRWNEVPLEMREKPYDEVLQHLLSMSYPSAKDAKFAEEAASWGVSSKKYQEWESRYLAAKDKPSPFPTNKVWSDGNLVARFLRRDDPRGLFLGQHTNCCQHPGNGHGAASAWNGLENPNAGYFVVERVYGKDENAPREIVAQSWAWISDEGNLVFDNVEAKTLGPRQNAVRGLYQRAANDLTEQFPIVTLGTTHGDLNTDNWPLAGDAFQKLPNGYTGNSDAKEKQVLLARRAANP
jgi:hypothetical protein